MPIVPVRIAMQFVAVLSAASAVPGLRASMMDVTPVHARGVSVSAFALCSTVFGTALAPLVVGILSDVTGSLIAAFRSEEHTSELQSLMRISYAVFCLKKKTRHYTDIATTAHNTYKSHLI